MSAMAWYWDGVKLLCWHAASLSLFELDGWWAVQRHVLVARVRRHAEDGYVAGWTPDLATRGDAWACAAADCEDEVRIQQEYEAYMAALDGTWQATWRTLDAYAGGPSVSELPLW